VSIVAEFNVESIENADLTPEQYVGLYRDLGYEADLIRRPRAAAARVAPRGSPR
jgi:hypothetical protein